MTEYMQYYQWKLVIGFKSATTLIFFHYLTTSNKPITLFDITGSRPFLYLYYRTLNILYNITDWRYVVACTACVGVAMLCKEQGITVTGVCVVYELFVAQKVSLNQEMLLEDFYRTRIKTHSNDLDGLRL